MDLFLARNIIGRSRQRIISTYLEFVRNHMSQSLVVNYSHENIGLKFPAINATVQTFSSVVVVASCKRKETKRSNTCI